MGNYSNLIGSPVVNTLDLSSIVKQQHQCSSKDSAEDHQMVPAGFAGAQDTVKLLKGAHQTISGNVSLGAQNRAELENGLLTLRNHEIFEAEESNIFS